MKQFQQNIISCDKYFSQALRILGITKQYADKIFSRLESQQGSSKIAFVHSIRG